MDGWMDESKLGHKQTATEDSCSKNNPEPHNGRTLVSHYVHVPEVL